LHGAFSTAFRRLRGQHAVLCLSLEPETAIREYQQLSPLMPPGTLVSHTIHLAPIVDFHSGYEQGR
jgi:hypothetical protein